MHRAQIGALQKPLYNREEVFLPEKKSFHGGPLSRFDIALTKAHFSCKVYRAYFTYLQIHHPDLSIEDLCREAGLSREYLEDENNFVSVIFDEKFTRLCIERTKESDLCFKIGVQAMSPQVMGVLVHFLVKNTLSIKQIFQQIPRLTEIYSKVTRAEILELNDNSAHIRLYALTHNLTSEERSALRLNFAQIFQNTLGHYAAIPTAQDLPPAHIDYSQNEGPDGFPIFEMRLKFESSRPLWQRFKIVAALVASISFSWAGFYLVGIPNSLVSTLIALSLSTLWVFVGISYFKQLRSRFDQAIRSVQNSDQRYASLLSAQTELKALSDSYKKFVPWEVIDLFELKNFTDLKLGQNIEREMTVMFVDIRSFTKLAERMTSTEVMVFLNSFFAALAPIIREQRGFIDKYIGDGLMAIFPKSAEDAVKAALKIQARLYEFNEERKNRNQSEINIGIGINSGKVTLGTIGYRDQMQNTVLSDVVNIASRLENETKYLGATIIVSEKTLVDSGLKDKIGCRLLGHIELKGKELSVVAYEIFEGRAVKFKEEIERSKVDFEYAIQLLESGESARACEIFNDLRNKNPDDKLTLYYLERAKRRG